MATIIIIFIEVCVFFYMFLYPVSPLIPNLNISYLIFYKEE